MGEWMKRAAMIEGAAAPSHQHRLSEPAVAEPSTLEPCHPEPDYRQYPERYEFPRFVIPTADGLVEFHLAVPKEHYDAFAILELFVRHHGAQGAMPGN